MKRLVTLSLLLTLVSCATVMKRHRMKAAQRKMLDTHHLQQSGQWAEALAMAGRMHDSVSKSVSSDPVQLVAGATPVDLAPLMAAWTTGPYTQLTAALEKKDARRATLALTSLRQQCITCHLVLGKTQIHVAELAPLKSF